MNMDVNNKICLNGTELELDKANATVGSVLDQIAGGFKGTQNVISEIRIDGNIIGESDEAQLRALPVEKAGMVEIFTSTPQELAWQTLDTLEQYIDRLCSSIERSAIHYGEKNLVAGDAYFLKSIEGLELFIQTIGGIKAALKVGSQTEVMLAEADLMSTMQDLVSAKQQNNHVFMAELLSKDLLENLSDWKNKVFPFLRKWKTS